MKNNVYLTAIYILIGCSVGLFPAVSTSSPSNGDITGSIVGGYRVLPIEKPPEGKTLSLTVYRGDYIKFDIGDGIGEPDLTVPALSIKLRLPGNPAEAPYIKMKTVGVFPFTLGDLSGTITVVDYKKPNYLEVSSKEALELIRNNQPLVLDVRTDAEYKSGHLENAVLIPVQQLQLRIKDLAAYKNQDILVYCATGNRSTVASKILIDSGFKRIHNMRYGIYRWSRDTYPIVR
jgi:rhodanese-related sulfurtransferase